MIINEECNKIGLINLDSGFSFGRGLFETILVKKKPVLLKEHLDRLNNGLKKIGVNKFIDEDYFMKNFEKMQCKNCAVKIMVSENNVIFTKREISYKHEQYARGFSLTVSEMKRNPYSHMTYLKSFNYMDNIIERENAVAKGFDEVLFLNINDYVSEGSVSNVFYIKNNTMFTPPIECGLLPGIVREFIIKNFKNYCIIEKKFTLEELLNADGIFITNSLMGVMRVSSIDNVEIPQCEAVKEVQRFYEKFVEKFD